MLHLHDVMIGNVKGMISMSLMATIWRMERRASSLCIKEHGSGHEREGEKERERKSCKEEEEHRATTTMPYHRPIHALTDDVHVYIIRAMGWT